MKPELRAKAEKILEVMALLGKPMFVVYGLRTEEEQRILYRKGRTDPGKVVTNIDGVVKKSKHQLGEAVDMAFATGDAWGEDQPWRLYGEVGKALGLVWGGDWKSLIDRPHLELP